MSAANPAPAAGVGRPLWQIILTILLIGLAIHRAGIAIGLLLAELAPALAVVHLLQVGAALATAVGMWLARPWTVGALICLGVTLAAGAILYGFVLGAAPALAAAAEVLVIAVSTVALAWVVRRELVA